MNSIVYLEGGEGTGKSTIIAELRKRLAAEGFNVAMFNEPNSGTPFRKAIRELAIQNDMSNNTRALLMTAVRSDLYEELVKCEADIILMDRSYVSTYVYQGTEDNRHMLDVIHSTILDNKRRDVVHVLLTAEYKTAMQRMSGRTLDAIESKLTEDSYEEINKAYLKERTYNAVIKTDDKTVQEIVQLILDKI